MLLRKGNVIKICFIGIVGIFVVLTSLEIYCDHLVATIITSLKTQNRFEKNLLYFRMITIYSCHRINLEIGPQDPCIPNPCARGGRCIREEGSSSDYTCRCPAGTAGVQCELRASIRE